MALKLSFKPSKFAAMFKAADLFDNTELKTLDKWGLTVVIQNSKLSVIAPDGTVVVGGLSLADGVVKLAQKGTLPDIAKAPVKEIIKAAYLHALKPKNWTSEDLEEAVEGMVADTFFEDTPMIAPEKAAPMPFPTAINPEANKVKLIDAKYLYQPVCGTSESSTYFCVGISGPLRFGARRQGEAISIRVEGPVNDYSSQLIAAGFSEGYLSKGYTSVHFHGVTDLVAQRALGAVLSGSGLAFETPMPQVSVFAQEGS